jgi:hypothetical protein
MKVTLIRIATLGFVLGFSVVPARAEWLNYLVRTSGLAWSDGYHAHDQCPPRHRAHYFGWPGSSYGGYAPAGPYYFEESNYNPTVEPSPTPAEVLPSAPSGTYREMSPQARYQPRSRYFQALEAEARGAVPGQPAQLEARRPQPYHPSNRPPF